MGSKTITLYEPGLIIDGQSCLDMANELSKKIEVDKKILEDNDNVNNRLTFKQNEYLFYWLKFDYYNIRSLSSKIDQEDIVNGWFIWLKDFDLRTNRDFDSVDDKYCYFYEKYFDGFFKDIKDKNDYIEEAIWCYKNSKYHACACLLFTSIENVERSISEFDPKRILSMSKEIKKVRSNNVTCFNEKYYNDFEKAMNEFVKNNYYAMSTANDPEPKVINRNRVMHGIFTRKVNKIDCLKLFVLLTSMVQFNDWLDCYRSMKSLSNNFVYQKYII